MSPDALMRASPVNVVMRPVSSAYRFLAWVMSAADAPGSVVALKIASAASLVLTPKFAVGTSVWFASHTSACTIVAPTCMLWFPFNQVVVFSSTFVEASRDDCPAPRLQLVSCAPVPQHAPLRLSRYPLVSENMSVANSGEKNVAPPDPPTRNSLNTLLPNVERSDSDVVHRVDCWLPVCDEFGNGSCALLVVSGVELMWR